MELPREIVDVRLPFVRQIEGVTVWHARRCTKLGGRGGETKVLVEHGFTRRVSSSCSFYSEEHNIRVVGGGDLFLSGCPRSWFERLKKVTNKHFESKHNVTGESSGFENLVVMFS